MFHKRLKRHDGGGLVLEVDLSSILPFSFWDLPPDYDLHNYHYSPRYYVKAAAHGLVCISNQSWMTTSRCRSSNCVLNPFTGACVVLPRLPFKVKRWYLSTCAVTILGWSGMAWGLATYHLGGESGGDWVVAAAHKAAAGVRTCVPREDWRTPVHAQSGGKSFWYNCAHDKVHVVAPGEVEVGALDGPCVTQLGMDASKWERTNFLWPVLVAHPVRGAVFFVSELRISSRLSSPPHKWGVWRLVRERMEWEAVALLDVKKVKQLLGVPEVRQFTGPEHEAPPDNIFLKLLYAYAVGEFVCCPVVVEAAFTRSAGSLAFCVCLPAFNLDTGNWELLLHKHHMPLTSCSFTNRMPRVMELCQSSVLDAHAMPCG